jgi:hypothetical protein
LLDWEVSDGGECTDVVHAETAGRALGAKRENFLEMLIRLIEGNRNHARPGAGRRKRGSLKSLSSNQASKKK